MLYDSRPVQFNEYISDKYNKVHNELFNDALIKFYNDIINTNLNYKFVYELYKIMQNSLNDFNNVWNEYKQLDSTNTLKQSLTTLSINSYDFLKDIYEYISNKIDLIKNAIVDGDNLYQSIAKKNIQDFKIIYIENSCYLQQETPIDDSKQFAVYEFTYDTENNSYTYIEEYMFMSELEDYVILLEDESGTRISYNKYGELLIILNGNKFRSEDIKFNIINFIDEKNNEIFDYIKSVGLAYYKHNHRIVEIKNDEYWQPSSIIVISNVRPYNKVIYDLDKYWNMNQQYEDANISDIKILSEDINDAELIELNYVNGTAKFISRMNDVEFTVPFKYLDSNVNVSDDMTLNSTFIYKK